MNFEAPRNTIEYENQEEHPRISIEEKRQNRLFSQTYYREDRKRLAEDIRILRKTQKERRKDLDIGIAAAVERKSEQEHIAVDLAIDIERLSNDLAQLGNDFLTSLVHFFKKSSLQKTLASKQELLKISESIHLFYKDQETFFRERQLLIKDSSEITNTLRSFHADQLEKCREYEHLREQTSIQHFTETYGAAIIHGTMPFHSPNAALSKSYELDWVDKIDVILSIPLALSASTVHPDRPHFENHIPYGPVGIVLVSGQIVGASEQDAGTTRSSREQMPESPSALQTVLKNISQVMDTKNSSGRYNEFVVRTPGIGALWIEHSPNKQEQKKYLLRLAASSGYSKKAVN